jgi:hypothetical protein
LAAADLTHLAAGVLLPTLLPFLALHGLHSTLDALLTVLPVQLRECWVREWQQRVRALEAAGPPPMQLRLDSPLAGAPAAPAAPAPAAPAAPAAAAAAAHTPPPPPALAVLQQTEAVPAAATARGGAAAAAATTSHSTMRSWLMSAAGLRQRPRRLKAPQPSITTHADSTALAGPSSKSGGADDSGKPPTAPGASAQASISAAAAVVQSVPWHAPLRGFGDAALEARCDRCMLDWTLMCHMSCVVCHVLWDKSCLPFVERHRYMSWKHEALLQLDYGAALFEMAYIVVLMRRALHEPEAVCFLVFIVVKSLPHAPLVFGWRDLYLRCTGYPCNCVQATHAAVYRSPMQLCTGHPCSCVQVTHAAVYRPPMQLCTHVSSYPL